MKFFIGLALLFFGLETNALVATAVESHFFSPGGNLPCLDNQHQSMPINNDQVLQWEKSTPDQYLSRAYVQGNITQIYPDKTGHSHFAISLGSGGIEVIYNDEFGALPALKPGMSVTACGDYITVGPHAQLPSPMPAIIHWVHYNPGNRDGGKHPGGFLIIDGTPYGSSAGN